MIIDILQTKGVGAGQFDIFYNNDRAFVGDVSGVSSLLPCRLLRADGRVALSTKSCRNNIIKIVFSAVFIVLMVVFGVLFPPDKNLLLFFINIVSVFVGLILYVVFIDSLFKYKRRRCQVLGLDGEIPEFYEQSGGVLFMYSVIAFDGKIYKIYKVSKGGVEYMSIYLDDTQIGQIDIDICKSHKKDYVIYLLDKHSALSDMLSLFALYYHSLEHANRRSFKYGSERSWTFSRTNKYYNPSWVSDNFSDFQK